MLLKLKHIFYAAIAFRLWDVGPYTRTVKWLALAVQPTL